MQYSSRSQVCLYCVVFKGRREELWEKRKKLHTAKIQSLFITWGFQKPLSASVSRRSIVWIHCWCVSLFLLGPCMLWTHPQASGPLQHARPCPITKTQAIIILTLVLQVLYLENSHNKMKWLSSSASYVVSLCLSAGLCTTEEEFQRVKWDFLFLFIYRYYFLYQVQKIFLFSFRILVIFHHASVISDEGSTEDQYERVSALMW